MIWMLALAAISVYCFARYGAKIDAPGSLGYLYTGIATGFLAFSIAFRDLAALLLWGTLAVGIIRLIRDSKDPVGQRLVGGVIAMWMFYVIFPFTW
jgi:hypothetical protein